MPERNLVLYHAGCNDGHCAAWIVWQIFGANVDYLPVQYGQEPPDVKDRDVMILDFSYKRPAMEKILIDCKSLIVLDHHKTAQHELEGLGNSAGKIIKIEFDMTRSGAELTWNYFHADRPAPWLVSYTSDRDMGRTFNGTAKMPKAAEVNAAISSRPRTFEAWEDLHKHFDPKLHAALIIEGSAILRYQDKLVEEQEKHAVEVELDGHKVLMVNATLLISEITGKLALGRPCGASFFVNEEGNYVVSLRSDVEGVDVSEIAKKRGGGGHPKAAGFTTGRRPGLQGKL